MELKFKIDLTVTADGYGRWIYKNYVIAQYAYIIADNTAKPLQHFIVYHHSMRIHKETILTLKSAIKKATAHYLLHKE